MYGSLIAFFSSLIRAPPSVVDCFRYRNRRLVHTRYMAEEGEKPTVTELLVRMDCNGCVQRIKKALHHIDGVYEVYTDIAQQKLTVVGRADPERIVKAIKRTKKNATICSHIDPAEPAQPINEELPSGEAPPPEPAILAEAVPVTEPVPPVLQEAKLEMNNIPPEVRMVHEYSHDFGHRDYWGSDPYYYGVNGMRQYENNHNYVTHSYNSYRPSTYVSEYRGYTRSPMQEGQYGVPAYTNNDYYHRRERADGQITSAFSDENPNGCTIV
ncbi:hypothetical protein LUZ62_020369 [Rhynchospora pubera]|uniref:HMA domain-containing protein n=1 Tax=Rhynchospora pubera TaxID=906938 RepID=A0AAV8GXR1_9POAL|nr:hypothetical protein LUZ62_020369 [Rhynchospora pubera]